MNTIKLILTLLMLPCIISAQKSKQIALDLGFASTTFQNQFEKTFNANPNGVWKPSIGLGLQWMNKEKSGSIFSLGLRYASYGLDFEGNYGQMVAFITTNETAKLSYFQVPIEIGYHIPKGKVNYYTKLGLLPSFLTSSSFHYRYAYYQGAGIEPATIKGKADYLDNPIYNSFQLFGQAKLGILYSVGANISFQAGLAYQYSFLDIENMDSKFTSNYEPFWTNVLCTSTATQGVYTTYDNNGQGTNHEYTTKTPTTKLSSFGIQLGLNYSF